MAADVVSAVASSNPYGGMANPFNGDILIAHIESNYVTDNSDSITAMERRFETMVRWRSETIVHFEAPLAELELARDGLAQKTSHNTSSAEGKRVLVEGPLSLTRTLSASLKPPTPRVRLPRPTSWLVRRKPSHSQSLKRLPFPRKRP